jgi:hypothetical protein
MNFVFGMGKADQKPYNSFIEPMEMMQWDELQQPSVCKHKEMIKRSKPPVPLSS